jgi:hypothetical protein
VRGVCVRVECAGAMGDMDNDIILGVQPGVAAPTDHPLDLHTRKLRSEPSTSLQSPHNIYNQTLFLMTVFLT